jgi:hypothetical protein
MKDAVNSKTVDMTEAQADHQLAENNGNTAYLDKIEKDVQLN